MHISDSIIEQLNSQADLVGLIGKHTTLKKAGREFKGCCPFHGEKTPSFYVNPENNLYYCFGCHARGNAITFLKEFERLNFIEAVKLLSEQTGIELPKDNESPKTKYKKSNLHRTQSPIVPDVPVSLPKQNNATIQTTHNIQDDEGDLYALLENVARYYQYMLHNTPFAKKYFLDRGICEDSIAYFGLGYAPEGWQHLEQIFPNDIEGLKILGLIRDSQKGSGRSFNLLRHRVIFPIRNHQGRVVGFAGRTLGDDTPKYINSSESPVFQKQHILYGFYEARQQRPESYLMVEGYMDVIALHQAGIYGAVAPMGTAANTQQIERLLRYHDSLTLCFDGDDAGQHAAWRTLEIAAPVLQDGKSLKFLTLPDHHDPDTFIKAYGATAMRQQIEQSASLSDYIYQVLLNRLKLDRPEQKASAMAQLKQLTALLPKGSSLRWWLNNDIYQKIKLHGKSSELNYQVDQAKYNLKNSTPAQQICLCLLFQPSLLKEEALDYLILQSQLDKAHHPYQTHIARQRISVPDLPNWQSFHDNYLKNIVSIIQGLLQNSQVIDMHSMQYQDVQSRAYFLLASIRAPQRLINLWKDFFIQIKKHQLKDIKPLFYELLVLLIKDYLNKTQTENTNLLLSEINKKRLQVLTEWDKKHNKTELATLFSE